MSMIDLATLRHLYIDEQHSIRSIAAILHVNPRTVYDAMMHARIPRRKQRERSASTAARGAAPGHLEELMLRRLYLIERRSMPEIARLVGISATTVQHALVYWNIPRRRRGRPEVCSELSVSRAAEE